MCRVVDVAAFAFVVETAAHDAVQWETALPLLVVETNVSASDSRIVVE